KEKPVVESKPEDKFETILFLPEGETRKGEGGLRTKGYFKKSYEEKPLISIITVVFNGVEYLEQTIQSVINQSYDNVEYIIIDGGSTDGTVDIIRKYEDQIDYWVSEKDKGIYDAMNKGLQLVVGEYVGIINADDFYEPFAIEKSIECIKNNNADYSMGKVQYVNTKQVASPIYPLMEGKIYQEMFYPHISAFILRTIYKKIGFFDMNLKIASDHDMALQIHLAGFKAVYVEEIIGKITEDGISSGTATNKEFLFVAIKNGKNRFMAYLEYVNQVIRVTMANRLPGKIVEKIQKLKEGRFQYEE
ncbi:MAG: glycosyltransferase, partial [Chlamydiia bacterium]|nr:glycosyltransferase [Chlamydiia bacterium]